MIAITGATGLLVQHLIENLLQTVPANQIEAFARDLKKGSSLSQK
ncbi:SDR family oxidoreductase, partial [Proteus mirabilis]